MTATTLADDLLLALLDPESGRLRSVAYLEYGLAGALLLELATTGRIDVVGANPRKAEVVVLRHAVPEDDLLGDALRRIAERRRGADKLVPALSKGLRARLLDRAERRGDLRRERLRFRPDRWYPADDTRRRALSAGLHDVLVAGVRPDARTAALVALLAAVGAAPAAVDAPDRATRKAVTRRATEVGDDAWAAEGVRRAVKAAQAAIAASTTAAVMATMISSTSG